MERCNNPHNIFSFQLSKLVIFYTVKVEPRPAYSAKNDNAPAAYTVSFLEITGYSTPWMEQTS